MTERSDAADPQAAGASCWLEMACQLDQIRPTTAAARSFLLERQVSHSDADACELALVEACNNAVQYTPPEKQGQPIHVQVLCRPERLELHVIDHSPGFDWPAEIELPSPEEEHGRGLFIIHSLMDDVAYLRSSTENRLVLGKRRVPSPAASASRIETTLGIEKGRQPSLSDLQQRLALTEQATATMAKELCFRSEALHAIFRCSSELGRGGDVGDFADRLLGDLLRIAEADWFLLRLVSNDRARLEVHNISHPDLNLEPLSILPTSDAGDADDAVASDEWWSVEKKAVVTRREAAFGVEAPLAEEDPLADAFPQSRGFVRPIFHGETLLGTLTVGRKSNGPSFSNEQIEVIHTFSEFLAIQIVNADLRQKQMDLQVTAHELEIARNIQESLLPKFFPAMPGYGLAGFCLSARHVGGDFYDAFEVARGKVLLVVADVMGKGIPAALFAATLHTLLRTMAEWTYQPAELLARMNRQMFEELSAVDMFITVQIVLVDTEERLLTVANAGHCPLLVVTKSGENRACAPEGLPLGILPRAIFGEARIPLDECSAALLYTDGLTEARNLHGEFFGQHRLEKWLQESAAQASSAYELSWKFMADLKSFETQVTAADDQTFLILSEEAQPAVEEGNQPPQGLGALSLGLSMSSNSRAG